MSESDHSIPRVESEDELEDCPICMCSYQDTHHKTSLASCCKKVLCSDCLSKVSEMLRGICPFCRRQATSNKTSSVARSSSWEHEDFNDFDGVFGHYDDIDDFFDDIYEQRFGHRWYPEDLEDSDSDGDTGQAADHRFLSGVVMLLRGAKPTRRRRLKPMQRICEHFQSGCCRRGDRCTFAHGQKALRQHNMPSEGGDSKFLDFESSTRRELQLLRSNGGAKEYSSSLTSYERKVVHMLAEELGLRHRSYGNGEDRAIKVWDGMVCPFQCEIERQRSVLPECRITANRVTTTSRKLKGALRSHHEICFELVEPAAQEDGAGTEVATPSAAVARRKRKVERKKRKSKPIVEKLEFMTEEEFLRR